VRAAFLGTPPAAVPALESLCEIADVTLVVTQPDRPRGRSNKPQPSPVKSEAVLRGIPVSQPEKSSEIQGILTESGALDVAVLVAYGKLIRPEALAVPRAGFVNVHFSILPRWRGAAPVQRAVLSGDRRTGVTLMQLGPGLDTGPIWSTATTGIGNRETAASLTLRLAGMGAGLLRRWLEPIVNGAVAASPQSEDQATYAAKIETDERWLDLTESTETVLRRIRGLTPWPGAWVNHDGGKVKILDAEPGELSLEPGEISLATRVEVGVGDGSIALGVVQPEGKGPMDAEAWMRGRQGGVGRFR
jgi:methionyl-tRNA formyltransferase